MKCSMRASLTDRRGAAQRDLEDHQGRHDPPPPQSASPSTRVTARPHAARVSVAVALVVLTVLVDAIERTAACAEDSADRGALAGSRAASSDGTARRADDGTDARADRSVLHDLGR